MKGFRLLPVHITRIHIFTTAESGLLSQVCVFDSLVGEAVAYVGFIPNINSVAGVAPSFLVSNNTGTIEKLYDFLVILPFPNPNTVREPVDIPIEWSEIYHLSASIFTGHLIPNIVPAFMVYSLNV